MGCDLKMSYYYYLKEELLLQFEMFNFFLNLLLLYQFPV